MPAQASRVPRTVVCVHGHSIVGGPRLGCHLIKRSRAALLDRPAGQPSHFSRASPCCWIVPPAPPSPALAAETDIRSSLPPPASLRSCLALPPRHQHRLNPAGGAQAGGGAGAGHRGPAGGPLGGACWAGLDCCSSVHRHPVPVSSTLLHVLPCADGVCSAGGACIQSLVGQLGRLG